MDLTPAIIENEAMRLIVLPGYGARVTNLVDKASGRDWIEPGPPSPNTGEDAAYLGAEAAGWDECFPTVGVWDAGQTAWRRRLRDHGDLWGRAWQTDLHTGTRLDLHFEHAQYRFARSLELDGPRLTASYRVTNLGTESLPCLWALHCLFAVSPEDRIVLPGIDSVRANHLSVSGQPVRADRLAWPGPNAGYPHPLDRVRPASARVTAKLHAANGPVRAAQLGHGGEWLELSWDERVHGLALWFNYGAWPQPRDIVHIALEPSTAPADSLGQAIAEGTALILAPDETRQWSVSMRVAANPG
jgi:galactose mutarotase-like enzyme